MTDAEDEGTPPDMDDDVDRELMSARPGPPGGCCPVVEAVSGLRRGAADGSTSREPIDGRLRCE